MSLYNILHGKNPYSTLLLRILGLDDTTEKVGRFRDIWLSNDMNKIIIFTRNGGGNRICWEYEDCDIASDDPLKHNPKCLLRVNYELTKHPLYFEDYDDEYDCTYAYFEFRTPDKFKPLLERISKIYPKIVSDKTLQEMTAEAIKKIEAMSIDEFKQNYPQIDGVIQKIVKLAEETKDV